MKEKKKKRSKGTTSKSSKRKPKQGVYAIVIGLFVALFLFASLSYGLNLPFLSQNNVTTIITSTNISFLNISTSTPYDTLKGYWSFDADDNISAYDFSGFNNRGNYKSTNATNGAGIYDNALILNGTERSYINFSSSYQPVPNGENFSLFAWVKPAATGLDQRVIVGRNDAGSGLNNAYALSAGAVNTDLTQFRCGVYNETNVAFTQAGVGGQGIGNTSIWDAWACTFNGTQLSLYKNGVLTSINTSIPIGAPKNGTAVANFIIGASYNGAFNMYNGSIDEVMVFNSWLNSSQVAQVYANTSARFISRGAYNYNSVSIGSGNIQAVINTTVENRYGTNISATLQYYDGTWRSSAPFNLTGSDTVAIPISTTNISLNLTFSSNANSFYTPILKSLNVGIVQAIGFMLGFINPTPADGSVTNNITSSLNLTNVTGDSYSFIDVDNSTVLWVTFENTTGSTVYDSSSYNTIGNINGSASITTSGHFGHGLSLTGNLADYLQFNNTAQRINRTDFSISMWVNFASYAPSISCLVGTRASTGNFGFDYSFQNSSGIKYLNSRLGNGTDLASSDADGYINQTFDINTWQHLVYVFKDNKAYWYINGIPNWGEEADGFGKQFSNFVNPINAPLYIGRDPGGFDQCGSFNGTIDDIVIVKRAISQSEVSALFNSSVSGVYTNFIQQNIGGKSLVGRGADSSGAFYITAPRNFNATANSPVTLVSNTTHDDVLNKIYIGARYTYGLYNTSNLYNQSQLTVTAYYGNASTGTWSGLGSNLAYSPPYNSSEWVGMFGDSITGTEGANAPADQQWSGPFDIYANAYMEVYDLRKGMPGSVCSTIIDNVITNMTADTDGGNITFQCGTNDLSLANSSGTINHVLRNYTRLFDAVRANGETKVYLINILPRNEATYVDEIQGINNWLYSVWSSGNYSDILLGFANVYNSSLQNTSNGQGNPAYMTDNLHPNPEGTRIYASVVLGQAVHYRYYDGFWGGYDLPTINGTYDVLVTATDPSGGQLNETYLNAFTQDEGTGVPVPITPTDLPEACTSLTQSLLGTTGLVVLLLVIVLIVAVVGVVTAIGTGFDMETTVQNVIGSAVLGIMFIVIVYAISTIGGC